MGEIIFSKGMQLSRRQIGSPAARYMRAGYAIAKRAYPYARAAYNAYKRSNVRSQPSKSARTPPPISFQHDYQTQYRRRSAPKRLKRRLRRYAKNFRYQLGKSLGQFSRVFNFVYAPATLTPTSFANCQTIKDVVLYGASQTDTTDGTLLKICTDLGVAQSTAKIQFKSAVLDVQIRNTDSESPLIVDAYRVVCRRESYDAPGLEFSQCLVNQAVMTGASNMNGFQMGVTSWDAPGFGSKWLILGKTRYRIGAGNSVYLQLRDPKNYEFDTARLDYDSGATTNRVQMLKGMTKGWIFIARSSALDATQSFSGEINWEITSIMNYHYTVQESELDQKGAN